MEQLKSFQRKIKTQILTIEQELADCQHNLTEKEVIEKRAKLCAFREILAEYECVFVEELTPKHVKMSGTKLWYIYNNIDYRTIEQLDFSIRTYVILKRANYKIAQQLREVNLEDIPNISQKSIEEIKRKLNL